MIDKIYFESFRGTRLCGILSGPPPAGGTPAVVLCHGFSTNKNGKTNSRLEEMFNDSGLATFRFDFFGHGESGGKLEDITISEAEDDVLRAIAFVERAGYGTTGLVGSSFGGMASILAASRNPGLAVLALKSPVSDYMDRLIFQEQKNKITEWKKKGYLQVPGAAGQNLKLNYTFFSDMEKVSGYEAAAKISVTTLIVHGNRDMTVPVEQSRRLSQVIQNCRLEIIDGADHTYSQPSHFEKMLESIAGFVLQHIKR